MVAVSERSPEAGKRRAGAPRFTSSPSPLPAPSPHGSLPSVPRRRQDGPCLRFRWEPVSTAHPKPGALAGPAGGLPGGAARGASRALTARTPGRTPGRCLPCPLGRWRAPCYAHGSAPTGPARHRPLARAREPGPNELERTGPRAGFRFPRVSCYCEALAGEVRGHPRVRASRYGHARVRDLAQGSANRASGAGPRSPRAR